MVSGSFPRIQDHEWVTEHKRDYKAQDLSSVSFDFPLRVAVVGCSGRKSVRIHMQA